MDITWRVCIGSDWQLITDPAVQLWSLYQHVHVEYCLVFSLKLWTVINAVKKMFPKTSFTSLIVGVFLLYVLHTCWVMFGIVYTKPCDHPKGDGCISPYLAGNPRLQVKLSCFALDGSHGGVFYTWCGYGWFIYLGWIYALVFTIVNRKIIPSWSTLLKYIWMFTIVNTTEYYSVH